MPKSKVTGPSKRRLTPIQRVARGAIGPGKFGRKLDVLNARIEGARRKVARLEKVKKYLDNKKILEDRYHRGDHPTHLHFDQARSPRVQNAERDPVYQAMLRVLRKPFTRWNIDELSSLERAVEKIKSRKMGKKEYFEWAERLGIELPEEVNPNQKAFRFDS